MPTPSMTPLQRLLRSCIATQQDQLDALENLLVLAGERSSSLPDPHHTIEGTAAQRLIGQLVGLQKKQCAATPLIVTEADYVAAELQRPISNANPTAPSALQRLTEELMEFSALQNDALQSLELSASEAKAKGESVTIQTMLASKLFDVLSTNAEILQQTLDCAEEAEARVARQRAMSRQDDAPSQSESPAALSRAYKGSKGEVFAKALVSGAIPAALPLGNSNPLFAAAGGAGAAAAAAPRTSLKAAAGALLTKIRPEARESSTASSTDGSWKHAFHEAVLRTMLRSESPQDAIHGVMDQISIPRESSPSTEGDNRDQRSRSTGTTRPRTESTTSSSAASATSDGNIGKVTQRRGTDVTALNVSAVTVASKAGNASVANISRASSVSPSPQATKNVVSASLEASLGVLREEGEMLLSAATELLTEAQRMILDCDDAVLQLAGENQELRKEVHKLKLDLDRQRDQRDHVDAAAEDERYRWRNKCVETQSSLERLEQQHRQAIHERDAIKLSSQSLEGQLRDANFANSQLQQRLAIAEADNTRLLCEVNEARQRHRDELTSSKKTLEDSEETVRALRQRVKLLEAEAAQSFELLETSRASLKVTERKLADEHRDAKTVKVMFTKLEEKYDALKREVGGTQELLRERTLAVQHLQTVSRLKDTYTGSTPQRESSSGSDQSLTETGGAHPNRRPPAAGRLVRLSFDQTPPRESPASAGATPRHRGSALGRPMGTSPTRPAPPPLPLPPLPTQSTATPSMQPSVHGQQHAHVYKVLADAAQLLQSLRPSTEPHPSPESAHMEGTASVSELSHPTRATDAPAPHSISPNRRDSAPSSSTQQLLHELEEKERNMMVEAASLAAQERAVLERRSVVSSTLLAQRNQLLMKCAPDEEVEHLNNQISVVMERINQATAQIQLNKRSVENKMDLLQRQRRVLLASHH